MEPKPKKSSEPAPESVEEAEQQTVKEEVAEAEAEAVQEVAEPLTQDQRIQRLELMMGRVAKNFQQVEEYLVKFKPLLSVAEQFEQKQQAGDAKQPTGNAGLMAGAGQILPLIMQMMGNSGANPLGDELTKKVMEAGLEQMFAGTQLLKAMQTKMLADMGAKVVKQSFDSEAKSS